MAEFDTEAAAALWAARKIAKEVGRPAAELRDMILAVSLVNSRTFFPPMPRGVVGLLVPITKYAVRPGDISLFSAFLTLGKAIFGVVVAIGATDATSKGHAAWSALKDFYDLYRQIVGAGYPLLTHEFAIMCVLKDLKIASSEVIVEKLGTPYQDYLDSQKVELVLRRFERTGDRGFTKKTASGEWQLDGV